MNKIFEKYDDYFTVCSSSTSDSDMDCENIEDSGKRSVSTFKVKCDLNCPEKVKKVFSGKYRSCSQHIYVIM
jgi:hypothetical protein